MAATSECDIEDKFYCTPLHLAVMRSHRACLATLLEHNADPGYQTPHRPWSPLAEAISMGNRDMIKVSSFVEIRGHTNIPTPFKCADILHLGLLIAPTIASYEVLVSKKVCCWY